MSRTVLPSDRLAVALLGAALLAVLVAAAPLTDPLLGAGGSVAAGDDGVGGIERGVGKVKPGAGNVPPGGGPTAELAPSGPVPAPVHTAQAGDGLPGASGCPSLLPALSPAGALSGLHVTARPESPVVLVAGLELSPQPLLGGWLLPAPQVVVFAPPTDAEGHLHLPLPFALPPELTLVVQAWIVDPTGPSGWTATPALLAGPLAAGLP